MIDINDPETILRVGINPKGHIYVIAHGFLESGDRPWVKNLMNALLDFENDATVVVVDWRGGSSPPYYQAVANIRLIGAITAHVIFTIFVRF
jgi:pancreatic triacylglycerol lipase